MDYPKSVPGVGLVDGKFIDENTTTGQVGSLIPCSWGNAITDELLAVIQAAELAPDEHDNTQLLQAMIVLLDKATPEATATVLGLVKQASKQEAEDGTDDKKSMSALRVRQAFAKMTAASVISTSASKVLTANDLGLVLVDSSAGVTNITLPASNAALGVRDVIIRRVDNGGNRLTVTAAAGEKIKFHTHLRAEGYSFFVLMGAGDYWHLRSDGAGGWFPVARFDATPVGRSVFETSTAFQPGGWAGHNGFIYNRTEWPWAWDHAQSSGMLTTEALRAGNEGKWTDGDGISTFRSPEGRGEFMRLLDESRGIDAGRVAGSYQKPSIVTGDTTLTTTTLASPVNRIDNSADTFRAIFGYDPVPDTYTQAVWASVPQSASGNVGDVSSFGAVRPRNLAYPGRLKMI